MPIRKQKNKCGLFKGGTTRPPSKDLDLAPSALVLKGSKYCDSAMGKYFKMEGEYLSCPVYKHENQDLLMYKKGKRWRIGKDKGSDQSLLACTDGAWWPSDIDHIQQNFWQ
jgi:hypothetical protein